MNKQAKPYQNKKSERKNQNMSFIIRVCFCAGDKASKDDHRYRLDINTLYSSFLN